MKRAPPPGPPPAGRPNTESCKGKPPPPTFPVIARNPPTCALNAGDSGESSNETQLVDKETQLVDKGSDEGVREKDMGVQEPDKGTQLVDKETQKDSWTLQIESGASFVYIAALDVVWGCPRTVDIYANRCVTHHATYQTTSTQTTSTGTTSTQTTSTQTTLEVFMKEFGGLQSF